MGFLSRNGVKKFWFLKEGWSPNRVSVNQGFYRVLYLNKDTSRIDNMLLYCAHYILQSTFKKKKKIGCAPVFKLIKKI